jgi:hypothetical protein
LSSCAARQESVNFAPAAPVAQLDRVLGFEPSGREFESLRARQLNQRLADTAYRHVLRFHVHQRRSMCRLRGGVRDPELALWRQLLRSAAKAGFLAAVTPARAYIGTQLLEVIFTAETVFKYFRVAIGTCSSVPVISTFARSFHPPPSVNVSARLKLHL